MIVVTTPTGAIGRQVLARLLEAGEKARVVVRDPARLPAQVRDRVEVVPGSHGDPDVVARAFTGADAVFWLVPPSPHSAGPDAAYLDFSRPACAAFADAGVRRVVGVSALGRGTPMVANAGLVTATLALDDMIAATGVPYRALTLPSFMENLLRQIPAIRDHGVYVWPMDPDHAAPLCATADIAAVAAELLLDDAWTGTGARPVLGPEDLSGSAMAQIMTEVLGTPVRYQQVGIAEYTAALAGYGMSAGMVQGMADMMVAKSHGLDNAEPRTPHSSSPTSFRQWCAGVLRPALLA